MNTINIRSCMGAAVIGKRGENEVTQVVFDYSSWVEQFGDGARAGKARRTTQSLRCEHGT